MGALGLRDAFQGEGTRISESRTWGNKLSLRNYKKVSVLVFTLLGTGTWVSYGVCLLGTFLCTVGRLATPRPLFTRCESHLPVLHHL